MFGHHIDNPCNPHPNYHHVHEFHSGSRHLASALGIMQIQIKNMQIKATFFKKIFSSLLLQIIGNANEPFPRVTLSGWRRTLLLVVLIETSKLYVEISGEGK